LEGAYYVKAAKKLGEKSKFNVVNIVDLKRAQTIGILLARIKQPIPEISRAIIEVGLVLKFWFFTYVLMLCVCFFEI